MISSSIANKLKILYYFTSFKQFLQLWFLIRKIPANIGETQKNVKNIYRNESEYYQLTMIHIAKNKKASIEVYSSTTLIPLCSQ